MKADMGTTAHVLVITFRVWLLEIPVAAFNAFVLMDRVLKPRTGPLRAHQIAMGIRIAYLFVYAYFLVYFARDKSAVSLFYAGLFWMGLMLTC